MRGSLATLLALAWLLGVGPLQGVYSQQYAPPSESECRPYIERALKEQGSPDTPPASIEDTGSSEETAGPEIPLNEQTDPEATTAETVPESEEVNSAENVGEVTSGETDEPTLERERRSLDETPSSDGIESLEQVEIPTTEEASTESASESLEGETSPTEEGEASLEQEETQAIEDDSTESAENVEQVETLAVEEASAESVEQEVSTAEEASTESSENLEQGEAPAPQEASDESAESTEQGETQATEDAGAESTEQGSTESVEEPSESLSEDMQQDSPVESTEADLTSTESLEQDVAPNESAESSESTEQDPAPTESSESLEETVPAESLESVEQDTAPESLESLEETQPIESLESVEQDAAPESLESSEETQPIESLESLEETQPIESLESVEQDAAPESTESSEETVPTESLESLEQDAAPTETTESLESQEEIVPSESSESLEETVPAESSENVEQETPVESVESSESLEEGATPIESAESSESLEPTEEAASQEQGSADSVESTEQATEGSEVVSDEAAMSEEQVGETSQEEPAADNAAEEIVLERERRSLDDEVAASSEEKTEESSVEVLQSADSTESVETTTEPTEEPVAEQQTADETEATPVVDEEQAELDQEASQEAPATGEAAPVEVDEEEREVMPEEELSFDVDIPENLRPRDHIAQILKLDETSVEDEMLVQKVEESTLKELKRLYDNAIKPLEILYKYRDLSNRHFGDPEIFSKPLILFMGPWSGGKSTIINYLLDNEYTRTTLRTGAEPSPAYFNLLMWGEREEVLDGTQLAADWTFSGLQKFGQGLLDRLRGLRLKNRLLEKVNIVEIPGILEIRKQVERLFPFNDACQWFIDRADIIFLVYDPSKLDVGPETEAILDQLKGREYQTRIVLNKADQVRPEELMRVQGTLIWNISPLMSSSQPPVMYSTSLWSMPYEAGAPLRLLRAQERAFLRDMREAIDKRVENKIASARRFAVRVRNHAKMVDCYLTTYYNHKSFFGNRKKISDDIIERPQDYHIYEGLSTLTNISRYDLPDPETYRDFFQLNPLYDFQQLAATCTYFKGCPINRLDVAIAYDLPELVGKYKKGAEIALEKQDPTKS